MRASACECVCVSFLGISRADSHYTWLRRAVPSAEGCHLRYSIGVVLLTVITSEYFGQIA